MTQDFQSILAPALVLITLGVMIYFRRRRKRGGCGAGCGCSSEAPMKAPGKNTGK